MSNRRRKQPGVQVNGVRARGLEVRLAAGKPRRWYLRGAEAWFELSTARVLEPGDQCWRSPVAIRRGELRVPPVCQGSGVR